MTASLQDKLEHLYGLRLHAARNSTTPGSSRTPNRTLANDDNFRKDYKELLRRLGNPHLRLPPVIHVAGTNGKGSTVTFLRAIFEAGGKRVHTYTSPHLVRFNERLLVASRMIGDDALEQLLDEVMAQASGLEITFFEVATAMAFTIFARVPADLCIIEVGMGGRMDCTNIIPKPLATIITRISRDHTQYLGDTITQIAGEKAGIIKPGVPCIVGYQQDDLSTPPAADNDKGEAPSALRVLSDYAVQLEAPLHRAGHEWDVSVDPAKPDIFTLRYGTLLNEYPTPTMVGTHQLQNAGAALACVMAIANRESDPGQPVDSLSIHAEALAQGLQSASWPGRLQRLDHPEPLSILTNLIPPGAELWLDGGHNDSAGSVLAAQALSWHALDGAPLHLVIAMKQDKNADQFIHPLLPYASTITFIPLPGMAGASHDPLTLAQATMEMTRTLPRPPEVKSAGDIKSALSQIPWQAHPVPKRPGRVLITGSLFLVGTILEMKERQH